MEPITALLLLAALAVTAASYIFLYGYGVFLAAKAHPGWVIASLLLGIIPVTVAVVYLVTKKNLFLMGKD